MFGIPQPFHSSKDSSVDSSASLDIITWQYCFSPQNGSLFENAKARPPTEVLGLWMLKELIHHLVPQCSTKKANQILRSTLKTKHSETCSQPRPILPSDSITAWHATCQALQGDFDLQRRYHKADSYFRSLTAGQRNTTGAEVVLCMLDTLIRIWKDRCHTKGAPKDWPLAGLIIHCVSQLASMPNPSSEIIQQLCRIAGALGLSQNLPVQPNACSRTLPFEPLILTAKDDLHIPLSVLEMQLLHCGPYLDRTFDSIADDRVDVSLDLWQRRAVDVIDANHSLFVVVPTGVGKTFLSFYAMKRLLETDDDGVVVYVTPSEAAANHVAAIVKARCPKHNKDRDEIFCMSCTTDYEVNAVANSRILITTPSLLHKLLLSSDLAEHWASRIQRVIFDDIQVQYHLENGWMRQLLFVTSCPVVVLSTPISNQTAFADWLEKTQVSNGCRLVRIEAPYRYTDSRKYIYQARKPHRFSGLAGELPFAALGLDGSESFRFVHPVTALRRSSGLPGDFALEPRDCYTLWQAMKRHETAEFPVSDHLDPRNALPPEGYEIYTKKSDVFDWEEELKNALSEWMARPDSPFARVQRDLGASLEEKSLGFEVEERPDMPALGPFDDRFYWPLRAASKLTVSQMSIKEPEDLPQTVLPLLAEVHAQGGLPALVFNFDEALCEEIGMAVLSGLEESEKQFMAIDQYWRKRRPEWTEHDNDKNASLDVDILKVGWSTTEHVQEPGTPTTEAQVDEQGDVPDIAMPLRNFSFADYTKLSLAEWEQIMNDLKHSNVTPWLLNPLIRGIGIHHANLAKKYCHTVERLFSTGFLQVVIATETLSVGINTPCKTAVFCGDSVHLTPQRYREAAGRAGRRGFQLLGNVVFHGIPRDKVFALMSGELPEVGF